MQSELTIGEVCAGISGFGLGFERRGFKVKWWCEIDPNCRKLLASKYPGVESHDDIKTFVGTPARSVDVLAGGTPCQGFSISGLRGSMADDRSNLCLHFCRIADELNPRIILWENVPGVLNTKDNAFGCLLARLVGADQPLLPPGGRWTSAGVVAGPRRVAAWAIKDAQYFGVAQRRNRVFVAASPDPELPFKILFEPESVRRDHPPSREAGEEVTGTISSRTTGGGGLGTDLDLDLAGGLQVVPTLDASYSRLQGCSGQNLNHGHGHLVAFGGNNTSGPIAAAAAGLNAKGGSGRLDFETETLVVHALRAEGFDASEDGTGRGTPIIAFSCKDSGGDAGEVSPTLRSMEFDRSHANGGGQVAVAFHQNQRGEVTTKAVVGALNIGGGKSGQGYPAVLTRKVVRRLTPTECERLQGFPDGWTAGFADGPRYKMLGNAVCAFVSEWFARRVLNALFI